MSERASGGPVKGGPVFIPEGCEFTPPKTSRLAAELAEWKAYAQHLEQAFERAADLKRIGMEVQKRVNRGEVEGSYLDLRGVKIPRTEART